LEADAVLTFRPRGEKCDFLFVLQIVFLALIHNLLPVFYLNAEISFFMQYAG